MLNARRGYQPVPGVPFGRFVGEGEMFPTGYGIAWRTWNRPGCVAFPVPLNYVAGFLHDFWLDLRMPKALRDDVWSQGEHHAAFVRGVEAGRGLAKRGLL